MSKKIAPPHAKQLVTQSIAQAALHAHSGPLPDPEALAKYNDIIPDAAERILKMAESQASHRQELEQYVLKTSSRRANLGVFCAFTICMTAIFSGFYLALHGLQVSGTLFTAMGLGSLATTFIYGTQSQREERRRRDDANQVTARMK